MGRPTRDRVAITALLVTVSLTIILFGVVLAGARAATWSIEKVSLAPSLGGQLEGVSCTSPSICTAVGYTLQSGQTLVERWEGRSWSRQPSPNPLPGDKGTLSGVSCPATRSCVAVGSDSSANRTLIEHWAGRTWSIVETGTDGSLVGVSCPSSRMCMAVGSDAEYSFCCVTTTPIAMRWSGGQWLVSRLATRAAWVNASLGGVSCRSATTCVAVGSYEVGAACRFGGSCARSPLLERWNGSRWSIAPPPRISPAAQAALAAVWCGSDARCTVLGSSSDARGRVSAFSATGAASRWSLATIPMPAGATSTFPEALSCPSLDVCATVGNVAARSGRVSLLIAERDRSRWTIPSVSHPAGVGPTFLNGVSCTSSVVCVAVGAAGDQPLVERAS
jgi:hypothetical protein